MNNYNDPTSYRQHSRPNETESRQHGKRRKNVFSVPMLVIIDILLFASMLLTFAYFHHVKPQSYYQVTENDSAVSFSDINSTAVSASDNQAETILPPFSKEIIETETSYSSPNIAVNVTKVDDGSVVYYIQDIYVKSVASFRTAFANDQYGRWVAAETPEIAANNNAVCAINGDYYGASDKGIVIRNGTYYRSNGNDDDDILVLFTDGRMQSFAAADFNEESVMQQGVWQTWSFGPSLLDADGKAITEYTSEIRFKNPRTAVGYYEPGHYCFLSVDGRSEESAGFTLAEMAEVFEKLGCKIAYNLDGGQTSVMTFRDTIVNKPYRGGRECSDILYICDIEE